MKNTRREFTKKLIGLGVGGMLAFGGCSPREKEKPLSEPAVNPTGTWTVTEAFDGKTQTYEPTLKLKQEGDKLTGTFTRRHNQQDIEMTLEDVKLEASEISFTVSISGSGGATVVEKFHGKIAGDTIKEGTVKEIWNGEDRTSEHPFHWEAKRVKK
jgi:hypothetical protein